MHNNWPQGETLDAAARRGDLIREMMRERGYVDPTAIVEDILASVAAEERRDRAEWADRHSGDLRGRTLRTLTPADVAETAAFHVRLMVEIAAERANA